MLGEIKKRIGKRKLFIEKIFQNQKTHVILKDETIICRGDQVRQMEEKKVSGEKMGVVGKGNIQTGRVKE